MFLSCRPFVVNTTSSTGLLGVENVVLTTKANRTEQKLLDVKTVENKGKSIQLIQFSIELYE